MQRKTVDVKPMGNVEQLLQILGLVDPKWNWIINKGPTHRNYCLDSVLLQKIQVLQSLYLLCSKPDWILTGLTQNEPVSFNAPD